MFHVKHFVYIFLYVQLFVISIVIYLFLLEGGGIILDSSYVDVILQGFFLGMIAAVLAVGYNKIVLGKFVKALIKAEAVHPNFAKTFEQLNVKKTFFLSFALRTQGTLRKVVYELEDEDMKGHFYIPEDKLYRAGRIYGGKDVDFLMVAAVIIVLFIFFAIVLMFVPFIMDQIESFMAPISDAVSGSGT